MIMIILSIIKHIKSKYQLIFNVNINLTLNFLFDNKTRFSQLI